jgi:hypothetical protein
MPAAVSSSPTSAPSGVVPLYSERVQRFFAAAKGEDLRFALSTSRPGPWDGMESASAEVLNGILDDAGHNLKHHALVDDVVLARIA